MAYYQNVVWEPENGHYLFRHLVEKAKGTDEGKALAADLLSSRRRAYHNQGHLAFMWAAHQGARPFNDHAVENDAVATAILFHDAVYEPGRRDNEERSADLWMHHSEGSAWFRGVVRAMILATGRHMLPTDDEAERGDVPQQIWRMALEHRSDLLVRYLCDLDLLSLAAPRDTFRLNSRLLRLEAAHLTDEEWMRGQADFLGRGSADGFFRSPHFGDVFETAAAGNVGALMSEGI